MVNVSKSYGTAKVLISLTISFPKCGLCAIIGPSGSGKSTILNVMSLLEPIDEGELLFAGSRIDDLKERRKAAFRRKNVAYAHQSFLLLEHLSAFENVAIGFEFRGVPVKEAREKAKAALSFFNLASKSATPTFLLSGGEKCRLSLARLFSFEKGVILADEPTGSLDLDNAKLVMDFLKELSISSLVVMVTHDRDLAFRYADKVYELANGKLKEKGK